MGIGMENRYCARMNVCAHGRVPSKRHHLSDAQLYGTLNTRYLYTVTIPVESGNDRRVTSSIRGRVHRLVCRLRADSYPLL
jgi:hypothetical protein